MDDQWVRPSWLGGRVEGFFPVVMVVLFLLSVGGWGCVISEMVLLRRVMYLVRVEPGVDFGFGFGFGFDLLVEEVVEICEALRFWGFGLGFGVGVGAGTCDFGSIVVAVSSCNSSMLVDTSSVMEMDAVVDSRLLKCDFLLEMLSYLIGGGKNHVISSQ